MGRKIPLELWKCDLLLSTTSVEDSRYFLHGLSSELISTRSFESEKTREKHVRMKCHSNKKRHPDEKNRLCQVSCLFEFLNAPNAG